METPSLMSIPGIADTLMNHVTKSKSQVCNFSHKVASIRTLCKHMFYDNLTEAFSMEVYFYFYLYGYIFTHQTFSNFIFMDKSNAFLTNSCYGCYNYCLLMWHPIWNEIPEHCFNRKKQQLQIVRLYLTDVQKGVHENIIMVWDGDVG